jgi:hypothetical protein
MKFDPIGRELEGTPVETGKPKMGERQRQVAKLEHQQTAAEPEHPGTASFARTPPFSSEHTYPEP